MTKDRGSALMEEAPAPSAGHCLWLVLLLPVSPRTGHGLAHAVCRSGSHGAAHVVGAGSSKWQMQDGEMQGAIFFAQIRIGVLLSRKSSIWCRKLLFFFNSTCARRLLASRRRWHGGSEPAQLWRAAFRDAPAWTGSAVTTPVTPSVESWLHLELRLSPARGWQGRMAVGFGPGGV